MIKIYLEATEEDITEISQSENSFYVKGNSILFDDLDQHDLEIRADERKKVCEELIKELEEERKDIKEY